jgi:hypothetical protein
MMGAEGIRELLREIDLDSEITKLRTELAETSSEAKIKKIAKRLKSARRFSEIGRQARVDDSGSAARACRPSCAPWCRSMAAVLPHPI